MRVFGSGWAVTPVVDALARSHVELHDKILQRLLTSVLPEQEFSAAAADDTVHGVIAYLPVATRRLLNGLPTWTTDAIITLVMTLDLPTRGVILGALVHNGNLATQFFQLFKEEDTALYESMASTEVTHLGRSADVVGTTGDGDPAADASGTGHTIPPPLPPTVALPLARERNHDSTLVEQRLVNAVAQDWGRIPSRSTKYLAWVAKTATQWYYILRLVKFAKFFDSLEEAAEHIPHWFNNVINELNLTPPTKPDKRTRNMVAWIPSIFSDYMVQRINAWWTPDCERQEALHDGHFATVVTISLAKALELAHWQLNVAPLVHGPVHHEWDLDHLSVSNAVILALMLMSSDGPGRCRSLWYALYQWCTSHDPTGERYAELRALAAGFAQPSATDPLGLREAPTVPYRMHFLYLMHFLWQHGTSLEYPLRIATGRTRQPKPDTSTPADTSKVVSSCRGLASPPSLSLPPLLLADASLGPRDAAITAKVCIDSACQFSCVSADIGTALHRAGVPRTQVATGSLSVRTSIGEEVPVSYTLHNVPVSLANGVAWHAERLLVVPGLVEDCFVGLDLLLHHGVEFGSIDHDGKVRLRFPPHKEWITVANWPGASPPAPLAAATIADPKPPSPEVPPYAERVLFEDADLAGVPDDDLNAVYLRSPESQDGEPGTYVQISSTVPLPPAVVGSVSVTAHDVVRGIEKDGVYNLTTPQPGATTDTRPLHDGVTERIRFGDEVPGWVQTALRTHAREHHPRLFAPKGATPGISKLPPLRIVLLEHYDQSALHAQPRRQSPLEKRRMLAEAEKQLATGLARRATAPVPALSLVVAIEKRTETGAGTGVFRMCGTYNGLNANSVKLNWPAADLQTLLQWAAGSDYRSHTDLLSAYSQCALDPVAQELCAVHYTENYVLTPTRVPFGIRNAPAHLQAHMDMLLEPIKRTSKPYLDDVTSIHPGGGTDRAAWLDRIDDVTTLWALLDAKWLTVNVDKSVYFVRKSPMFGFCVTADRITPSPDRLLLFSEQARPTSKRHLKSWMHGLSLFASNVIGHSDAAAQLHAAAVGTGKLVWTDELSAAYERHRQYLLRNHVATHPPLPTAEVYVATDWCQARDDDADEAGVAWIIYQIEQDGNARLLASGARKSSNLGAIKGELGALRAAFDRDGHLLRGRVVHWLTDCKSLCTAFDKVSDKAFIRRVTAELSGLADVRPHYTPADDLPFADFLSRAGPVHTDISIPATEAYVTVEARRERAAAAAPLEHPQPVATVAAVTATTAPRQSSRLAAKRASATTKEVTNEPTALQTQTTAPTTTDGTGAASDNTNLTTTVHETPHRRDLETFRAQRDTLVEAIRTDQTKYEHITQAQRALLAGTPDAIEDHDLRTLAQQGKLEVFEGALYAAPLSPTGHRRVIVTPSTLMAALQFCHNHGKAETVEKATRYYYHPLMEQLAESYVNHCHICQMGTPPRKRGGTGDVPQPLVPFHIVQADLQVLHGHHFLTMTDRLTGFAWAKHVANKTAEAVANAMISLFEYTMFPAVVEVDKGKEFAGVTKDKLAEHRVLLHVAAAGNHARVGMVERQHADFGKTALRLLAEAPKGSLSIHQAMRQAVRTHNEAPRAGTGVSPAMALYGTTDPRVAPGTPLSEADEVRSREPGSVSAEGDQLGDLFERQAEAREALRARRHKERTRHIAREEKLPPMLQVKEGDRVLYFGYQAGSKAGEKTNGYGPYKVTNICSDGHRVDLMINGKTVTRGVDTKFLQAYREPRQSLAAQHAGPVSEWIQIPGRKLPRWLTHDFVTLSGWELKRASPSPKQTKPKPKRKRGRPRKAPAEPQGAQK